MGRPKRTTEVIQIPFTVTQAEELELKALMKFFNVKTRHACIEKLIETPAMLKTINTYDYSGLELNVDHKVQQNIQFSPELYAKFQQVCTKFFRPQQNMFRLLINGAYIFYELGLDE